jgi:beta-N-acetylhexosaminidase
MSTFGPVADVNNNPRNPVINIRSFGEDPARRARWSPDGSAACRMPACWRRLNIFPATAIPTSTRTSDCRSCRIRAKRLDAVELAPFKSGISAGAAGVMVAHIELPAIDPEKQPATFSPKVIGTLLRPGFDGLIYSGLDEDGGDHKGWRRRAMPQCAPSRPAST